MIPKLIDVRFHHNHPHGRSPHTVSHYKMDDGLLLRNVAHRLAAFRKSVSFENDWRKRPSTSRSVTAARAAVEGQLSCRSSLPVLVASPVIVAVAVGRLLTAAVPAEGLRACADGQG